MPKARYAITKPYCRGHCKPPSGSRAGPGRGLGGESLEAADTFKRYWVHIQGGFLVMAEITHMLPANICRQFVFVITTTANTRWMVENFQLICYSQWVNATSQYNNSGSSRCSKWRNDQTLLAPCARNKRLQRKMTTGPFICKVTGGGGGLGWGSPKNICLLGGQR